MASVRKYVLASNKLDLSGGVQTATSRILKKQNELAKAKNAVFNKKIGSATRRDGYEQCGRTIQYGNDGLGLHIYKYFGNNKIVVGINNSLGTNATLQFLDNTDYWKTILSNATPNTRFSMIDYLDEMYVAGYAPDSDSYQTLTNIDSTLTPSTTRNVAYAPKCMGIMEYGGALYAINCQVGGAKYKDRIYVSSQALGAVTFIQNNQQGLLQQLQTDSARYLKAGMVIDIYSAGTNAQVVSALTIITVNKSKNQITFAPTQINVKDNDEIWLSGRKGQLSILWNTDNPTPETADWLRIPPGTEESPTLTAWGKSNNRAFFFTKNSTWKWDGANLVNVSDTIGCVGVETVQNIGSWMIWLHQTGVWAYNDSTGQLKLLSRAVNNYITAINQTNLPTASSVVVGRLYKLSVGQVASDLDASTTSTSTSSTSTSSTSSSTSSTSTSSTSTSTTTTSTSTTGTTSTSTSSTSTSSTSTSTSSTSTSSTSSSTSMSTSSTTTTTIASVKSVLRLVYDFDANTWAPEYHKREQRFQLLHTMNAYTKPYFLDEMGYLWRDETGNLDGPDTIPFEIELGRDNQGTNLKKNYVGLVISSEKARTAQVMMSLDKGNWRDVGQITEDVAEFRLPISTVARDINFRIVHNDSGDAPSVDGYSLYYSLDEFKVD